MLLWAGLAGVVGALATLVFRRGISAVGWLLAGPSVSVVEMAESLPWYVRIALPTLGGLAAGGLLVLAPRYSNGAPSDYMESVAFGDGRVPARDTLLRSLSSLVTIASGGSIGREGAMVQLAAMCGSLTGRVLRSDTDRLRLLVACGAAAGIASAYNAPIAADIHAHLCLRLCLRHCRGARQRLLIDEPDVVYVKRRLGLIRPRAKHSNRFHNHAPP